MMLKRRILVSSLTPALCAVALSGCGQQGPLYLPAEKAAAERATLPQSVLGTRKPQPTGATTNPGTP